ncbi:aspartate kinase [Fervidobacterium changbaicum]|uniref:Aspartokinase n=2 Tax=Fervidobacterium TaxID=2422 RepID=A0AAI8CMR6_FERIS|nr:MULTISPECIES: aspartate kinase [Fervidobacterium]AMW33221.1 aspartate kinase [Fervidobacterium islandicum]QAV33282.1 aspartate kinase [Fervidobacterium changbaicum]SDH07229.1 aspartate kinase [Fervidobacterium changbaicum]
MRENEGFVVVKFGGSNFKSPEGYEDVIAKINEILRSEKGKTLVVVVSAAYGITDKLIGAVNNFKSIDIHNFLREIYNLHASILESNDSTNLTELSELESKVFELEKVFDALKLLGKVPDFARDLIVSYGERLNAFVLHTLLRRRGLSFELRRPEEWIITDGKFGNASVLLESTKELFEKRPNEWKSNHSIIPGFYGASKERDITLLGRGGSDYTATVLAYALNAEYVVLFKDVNGFLSGDPKIVENPVLLEKLSYDEIEELSYFGAKIVHPNAVDPLKNRSIPLYVCSFSGNFSLENCTEISAEKHRTEKCVKSVSFTEDIAIVQFFGANLGRVPGVLGEIAKSIAQAGLNIKFVVTSQTAINLIVSKKDLPEVLRVSEMLRLKEIEDISYRTDKALVAVVGYGLLDTHGIAAKVFGALAKSEINVDMISAGASEVSMYFLVDSQNVKMAVKQVHKALFEEA